MIRRRMVSGLVVAAVALAALVGCSGGGDENQGGDQGGNQQDSDQQGTAPGQGGNQELQGKIDQILQQSPLQFEAQSAELTDQANQTLQQVADAAKEAPEAKLSVNATAGYEDPGQAQELAQQRADGVKQQLTEKGLAPDQVEANAMGNQDVQGDAQKAVTVDIAVVQ